MFMVMKAIVQGNNEIKVFEVLAFETPAVSTERDRARRERMSTTAPKKLPSYSVKAESEDSARRMILDRYAKQRRQVRSLSPTPVAATHAQKFAGAFVVYVEPAR